MSCILQYFTQFTFFRFLSEILIICNSHLLTLKRTKKAKGVRLWLLRRLFNDELCDGIVAPRL